MAPAGELVERRDGHRGERGMTDVRIGDARPQLNANRMAVAVRPTQTSRIHR
jgi:hypothetical protein